MQFSGNEACKLVIKWSVFITFVWVTAFFLLLVVYGQNFPFSQCVRLIEDRACEVGERVTQGKRRVARAIAYSKL